MSRVQRALQHVDLDAFSRLQGFSGGARDRLDKLEMHYRLGRGGRITAQDIEQARQEAPHIPLEYFNRLADWINGGANARDRAERLVKGWAVSNGVPEHRLGAVYEAARRESEALAVQQYAAPITGKLTERDTHRDRYNGIDAAARAEASRRAALGNPDTQRRAAIEHALAQHEGPQPSLRAADRREMLAQASEHLVERMKQQQVRNTDPGRVPDRGDDRRDDVRLAFDTHAVNELAYDEIALRDNGLDVVDDALTDQASRESE